MAVTTDQIDAALHEHGQLPITGPDGPGFVIDTYPGMVLVVLVQSGRLRWSDPEELDLSEI
jgi:hypothetical protein